MEGRGRLRVHRRSQMGRNAQMGIPVDAGIKPILPPALKEAQDWYEEETKTEPSRTTPPERTKGLHEKQVQNSRVSQERKEMEPQPLPPRARRPEGTALKKPAVPAGNRALRKAMAQHPEPLDGYPPDQMERRALADTPAAVSALPGETFEEAEARQQREQEAVLTLGVDDFGSGSRLDSTSEKVVVESMEKVDSETTPVVESKTDDSEVELSITEETITEEKKAPKKAPVPQ